MSTNRGLVQSIMEYHKQGSSIKLKKREREKRKKIGNSLWADLEKLSKHFGTLDKNPPASAGDMGSIPGLGRFDMSQSN